MKNLLLIDIGSTTVKIYEYNQHDWLKHIQNHSIWFKNSVNSTWYINEEQLNQFIGIIYTLQEQFPKHSIKTYATDFFRKLSRDAKLQIIDSVYSSTKVYFNIISQDLESFYIQRALIGKYHGSENCLIINIWWGSTELVIMHQNKAIERHNVDLWIKYVLSCFPWINEKYSEINLDVIVSDLMKNLPLFNNTCDFAIYTWWELDYMQRTFYKLSNNEKFIDKDHPLQISLYDFENHNYSIFQNQSLEQLRNLMPENPNRMDGARPCSAIAQAILKKYRINNIIPSNSNIINWVIRDQFENVIIVWDFKNHYKEIQNISRELMNCNIKVLHHPSLLRIASIEDQEYEEETINFRRIANYIEKSDALVVYSPWGKICDENLFDVWLAYAYNKRIIFTEKISDMLLRNIPSEVGLILDA